MCGSDALNTCTGPPVQRKTPGIALQCQYLGGMGNGVHFHGLGWGFQNALSGIPSHAPVYQYDGDGPEGRRTLQVDEGMPMGAKPMRTGRPVPWGSALTDKNNIFHWHRLTHAHNSK